IFSREAGRSGLPKSLGSYRGQCHYRLAPTQLVRGWGTLVSWQLKPSRPLRGASPGSGASCVLDPGPTSVSQPNRGAEQTVGVGSHPTGQRRGNEIPPTHTTHTSFSSSYYM